MNNWLRIVQHFLARCLPIPRYCLICFRKAQSSCLCQRCEWRLPKLTESRPPCDLGTNTRLLALFPYQWPVSVFISKMKFQARLNFAHYFATQMVKHFKPPKRVQVIIPIPLHPKKQQKRGFNQNLEIAKIVARNLNIPLDRRSCTKIKDTPSQGTLSGSQRRQNIQANMFKVENLKAKHVMVIDDVVTTGTTMKAFIAALKAHGVITVEIWCCCLAQGH